MEMIGALVSILQIRHIGEKHILGEWGDQGTYDGKPLEPPAGLEPAIPGLLTFTAS